MQFKELYQEIEPELERVEEYLSCCLQTADSRLQDSYRYLLQAGGKRLRPAFAILSARYGTQNGGAIIPVAAAFELVHMASLVHDDIIDEAALRRGKPTIRSLFGNDFALQLGDYLFARALNILEAYPNPALHRLLAAASMEMSRAEIGQIATAYHYSQGIRRYFSRIKRKTSLFITLSCQAGALVGEAPGECVKALGHYGHCVGMAFQITDDVLDYLADSRTLGKPAASDIRQGIVTLPLIYAVNQAGAPYRKRLFSLLSENSLTEERIEAVVQIIKECGAVEYSLSFVDRFVRKAIRELSFLPDCSATEILRQIAKGVCRREN